MEFKDVENLGILKRFQRSLRSLTGLCFDFVDISARSSVNLRASKDFSPFCRLVHSTPSGRRACVECNIAAVKKCFKLRKPIIYNCHLGLVDIVVPLIEKIDNLVSRFYIRVMCKDQPGVLAQWSKVLADNQISISGALQHEGTGPENTVPVVIATHPTLQKNVTAALIDMERLDVIGGKPVCIRIVDIPEDKD